MKIQTECVPCLIKRIIFEARQSTNDHKLQSETIKKCCRSLSELYDPNECSAVIATKIHKLAYETLNDKDPYKKLKDMSNKIALSLLPRVEELVKKSDDPLKASMICAIIGNMMDFGIEGGSSHPDKLLEIFEKSYEKGLAYDDTDKVKKIIKNSRNVLFFSDNCGEIVLDKIFCRELKNFNPDINLVLVVRGAPVISDATLEDAIGLNFQEVVDEILTTGCFAVGIDYNNIPPNLNDRLDNADLIICKGMANYETFSETDYHPIAYFMRTKCNSIANSMNVPVNSSIVKLYR